ncbi:MAG TPA: serine/threonine-protein kinase [Vicinamibacterales bacterium]|nr:serine/threonine-protein kinase [Vicinamibacterales bacterium]
MHTAASGLLIGQRLGGYRIDALLGVGGMGTVYAARDRVLRRSVAIKVVDRADAAARRALLREARLAASLAHPAICGVHEVGCVGRRPFIVMERVDGRPLSAVIPRGVGLPVETALHYALQIVDAVAHAHARHVVHRDLKAANVMIDAGGAVKVLDFGLAICDTAGDVDTQTTRVESASGAGTVPYMAPEILQGRRASPRSDVWALGVLLHEMLAGARPFEGGTKYELAASILERPPAPLPGRVPAVLRRIVLRCLEKGADDRFPFAGPLAAALDEVPA